MSVVLRSRAGAARMLAVTDWCAPASLQERQLLASLPGPVLDLGSGPGRLVVALGELGIAALGVDASPRAVTLARGQGAAILERSLFDALPGEGRWPTVLLFDGNVGIGGDPVALLRRVGDLLAPAGRAVVEVEAPGAPSHATQARLEHAGEVSVWFPWAWVGADTIDDVAAKAGLERVEWQVVGDRWFAHLRHAAP
jgi:SAM-dependent methyltransferase